MTLDENQAAPAASSPKTGTADDRSTTFQAVEGGGETHSGATLLVEAYAIIWIVLMTWLLLIWRRQKTFMTRLEDLERAIDKAAAKQGKSGTA
jgi:hypothetical protein